MKCAYHPDVETNLRCGKCGKPICPKDMVQTPVGARCLGCAKLFKLPTYQISAKYYLRAAGSGIVTAIICGFIWWAIDGLIPFFSLNWLLAPAVGYATGEAISFSVNRKRGKGLATIAGIAVVISYIIAFPILGSFFFSLPQILFHLIAIALGVFVAVTRLR